MGMQALSLVGEGAISPRKGALYIVATLAIAHPAIVGRIVPPAGGRLLLVLSPSSSRARDPRRDILPTCVHFTLFVHIRCKILILEARNSTVEIAVFIQRRPCRADDATTPAQTRGIDSILAFASQLNISAKNLHACEPHWRHFNPARSSAFARVVVLYHISATCWPLHLLVIIPQ